MTLAVRKGLPRLPLDGNLDLTYRCNNTCRHCWLWLPPDAREGQQELSLDELRRIVDEARRMGCQAWGISGGEPMLRPDFAEIFDYLTLKTVHYTLNTNGTLITPEIARLLRRKGRKMVALYGASAEVHDHITRNPGSFEAALQGLAYLKEAGAGFTVQLIPMRESYHQYQEMLALAQSLSPSYRVGSSWLFFTACRSEARNREIAGQRLDPADVLVLDEPDPAGELVVGLERGERPGNLAGCGASAGNDRLFSSCVEARRDFHIDPYGQMSFCCFIKDPALRYDLRQGSFQQAWDEFIPSLADVVRGGEEYQAECGSCELRRNCRWCAVYGYLEHGRYTAKVDYLCRVAEEKRRFKEDWKLSHLRYYQIAGITIQLTTDFPMADDTFDRKFEAFRMDGPGEDTISIRLASPIPSPSNLKLGEEVFRRPPWAIYRQHDSWVYLGISPNPNNHAWHTVAIFSGDHRRATIFCNAEAFQLKGLGSLTTFPTDQILLARILADRQGCYIHASGMIIDGQGVLFVGHSEAGKSTMIKLMREYGEILCDDRIIVRRWPDGFRIHGTWSHGELPDVSPAGAPLRAIMFLEKAQSNELIPLAKKVEKAGKILAYVVKPLVTRDWSEKTLALVDQIAGEVPIYRLRFDLSGQVRDIVRSLARAG